jgi:hypothetical protein
VTTPVPYDPPAQYGSYPTAPPWAPAPPPAPPPPPPYIPYGRLMVPYPEEMFNAARPRPPSWIPVVVLTLLFGAFGAISAAKRAGAARTTLNQRPPYWIAFGVTMVAGSTIWAVVLTTLH